MMNKLKKLHKSWTIWFNSLVGTMIMVLPTAQDYFPQLQSYVPDQFYKYGMIVLVVGNFFLRIKTTKALDEK